MDQRSRSTDLTIDSDRLSGRILIYYNKVETTRTLRSMGAARNFSLKRSVPRFDRAN